MTIQAGDAETAMRAGAVVDRDLPDADLRTLGPAMAQSGTRFPQMTPTLLVAGAIGLVTALVGMMVMVRFDNRITSPRQVMVRFGVTSLAVGLRGAAGARMLARGILTGLAGRGWLEDADRIALVACPGAEAPDALAAGPGRVTAAHETAAAAGR